MLTIGGLIGTGNLLFIAATRRMPASQIAPLHYSQILWALLLGAVFYAEYQMPSRLCGLGYAGGPFRMRIVTQFVTLL